MPTALETLVKILKLEREQGGKDSAVVGGLGAYIDSWQPQAREQARRPQHQILIDEIVDALAAYDNIDNADARIAKISYLLDRMMNRRPPPPAYKSRLPEWADKMKAAGRLRRDGPPRHAPQTQRSHRKKGGYRSDSANYDDDYASSGYGRPQLDLPPLPTLSRPPRISRPQRSLEEQLALQAQLEAPTTAAKGIGKKFAELLEQLELYRIRDLLYSFPRHHNDYTVQKPLRYLTAGEEASVIASIERVSVVAGRDLLVTVSDGTGRLSIRFFRQQYLAARLQRGMRLALRGKFTYFRDMPQMANPEWEELDIHNLHTRGIVPVYRMTKGLRQRLYRRTLKSLTAEWAAKMPDPIPPAVLERAELAGLGWALQQAHFPAGWDHLRHARRRLIFDDLLMLQLAMLGKRRDWQAQPGPQLDIEDSFLQGFIQAAFPFELTGAQQRAIEDIRRDVTRTLPMNRLIQGDVGAGKTAVAIVALAMALTNGKQSALMAPTGVLAEQHYRVVCETFAKSEWAQKPVIALLTSALTTAERESIYRGLADGSIDIVVGTHALIQAGVEFHALAIAIIDEQQRFGVDQRARLRGKGENPHLLVMAATPIPRTLALTVHADLDITVIDEKPVGRKKILTKIIEPPARERLHGFVSGQLEQGRQAFFVHPLVEESETIDTASALKAYERLQRVFFRFRVCLLHGRMSPTEKDDMMAAFAAGEHDVMVTTSIAELGVDVGNASVIVIDGANRFGLAQLHQFRGRVGRGEQQSYCFLLPDSSAAIDINRIRAQQAGELPATELNIAEQRLAALEETDDGFALAELDWRLRGAGDLLGRRQSGQSALQMSELVSPGLVAEAQREARTIYEEDPDLQLPQHQLLADCISRLYADSGDLS